jgi:hypothetical protein
MNSFHERTRNMDPHHREAAAAEAAIADFYGTVYRPKPGDRVRCPLAFGGGYQTGVIAGPEGDAYLVDTAEGRLLLYLEELEPVVEPCRPVEQLTTPAKPGSHNAGAARKAGCEDAYDNAMQSRYGEGW